MNLIENAIKVARKFYDENTYQHAMRVAAYVTSSNLIPEEHIEKCVAIAIMHDLLEDTEFDFNRDFGLYGSRYYIKRCLDIVTHNKEKESYHDYLIRIKNEYTKYPEAYLVKLADMKDHLSQKDTLTNDLKEKYLNALPCLL